MGIIENDIDAAPLLEDGQKDTEPDDLEQAGFEPIMAVYDEAVCIGPEDTDMELYMKEMCKLPQWAIDLGIPVVAEGSKVKRYTK